MTARYESPPRTQTAAGKPRRCGVEIEFTGVPLLEVGRAVVDLYGGTLEQQDRFEWEVEGSTLGTFTLVVDSALLLEAKYRTWLDSIGLGELPAVERFTADALEWITSPVVPYEIVTEPLTLAQLPELERLRARLHAIEAEGTGASVLHGFGLHLNPEAPDLEADTLRDYMRAFLILVDWLPGEEGTDLTRRILPFIDPFPAPYARRVVDPQYEADRAGLIDDYIAANPTRNRPLDMLPLFAEVDRERVMHALPDAALVKPRPAFHYRLPDCRLDQPEWTLAEVWNRWVAVERLAGDAARLREAGEAYLAAPPDAWRAEDWV